MAGFTGLRWGRGLFRLWLFVTLLWLGFLSLDQRPDRLLQEFFENTSRAEEVARTAREPFEMTDTGQLESEGVAELEHMRRRALMMAQARQLEAAAQSNRTQLQNFIWGALIPPFILFLIGGTLFWAIRGFRRGA